MMIMMGRVVTALCFLLVNIAAVAQVTWNRTYQQYIDQYKDLAIEQMRKYRIPASITLAQGLLESGAGKSELAVKGNNHFGIKCHGWDGKTLSFDDDAKDECFRAYKSVKQSYEDHSKFLLSERRYSKLFKLKITDYKGWARGLKAAGYATNPQYADRLIKIIEVYRLDRYDRSKKYDKFIATHPTDRDIYQFNKNYYITARRGDTFKSIGKEMNISARSLASYNERNRKDALEEGEIIWLKEKKKKLPKEYRGKIHRVEAGESMYSIAQRYGITVKSLYKMTGKTSDYEIKAGDMLRLK